MSRIVTFTMIISKRCEASSKGLKRREAVVVVDVDVDVGAEPDDPVQELLVLRVRLQRRGHRVQAAGQATQEILQREGGSINAVVSFPGPI